MPVEQRATQVAEVIAENAPMTPPAGLAAKAHAVAESADLPLPEDQIMLMQTLIGAWPLDARPARSMRATRRSRPTHRMRSSSASPRGR